MTDISWTLWIFAGPGALTGPLADVLARARGGDARAPAGVRVFAETIEAPTFLQELTGEWPMQRLAGGPGEPICAVGAGAERDLGRFIAWAEANTPPASPGSRRALIVLGDLLRATGAAPMAMPLGVYRPDYPSTIIIKKLTATTSYNKVGDGHTYTGGGLTGASVSQILGQMAVNDAINFEEDNGNYYKLTSVTNVVYSIVDSNLNPRSNPTQYVTIDPGDKDISIATATPPAARSLDAVGPAEVDRAARRVDVVVTGLDGRRVDLLVSDDGDLARLEALRRLAPQTTALLGASSSPVAGAPLLAALLDALAGSPGLDAEGLARATVERLDAGARALTASVTATQSTATSSPRIGDVVALRSSHAAALLDALDRCASAVLDSGAGSAAMRCFTDAVKEGGDLGLLTTRLTKVDGDQARAIDAAVGATVIARSPVAPAQGGPRLGVGLDGSVLSIGGGSAWARLLDAVRGDASSGVVRQTLADVQVLAARSRRSAPSRAPGVPLRWIEYDPKSGPDFVARTDFAAFLARSLGTARHVALVVRGQRTPRNPASITLRGGDALAIVSLARELREALGAAGRGPLALLVLEDPELLALELGYELRDVAHVLLTGVAGAATPALAQLAARVPEAVVRGCEAAAADALTGVDDGMIAARVHPWRRDVARRLADLVVAPDQDRDGIPDPIDPAVAPVARRSAAWVPLQGIDLRHLEALCRRFDRLCQVMFDGLGDEWVLKAVHEAATAPSLLELVNRAQMQALYDSPSAFARALNDALGPIYNWIAVARWSRIEGGAPFWIDPGFVEDLDPSGKGSRLRVTLGPNQPRDYRELSFHRDVRLHALLAAGRLLRDAESRRLWGLVSLGLEYAPESERGRLLGPLLDEPDAAHYFTSLGAPPLLSLDIDKGASEASYELRLASSESSAVLVRQSSRVDLGAVERSLDGLGYVLSRGVASREGWGYLESLGSSLAEDIVNELRDELEREREVLLRSGRCRVAHLALALPRELMRFPWELMRLPSRVPGHAGELLAERFALGRQMWSDRALQRERGDARVRLLLVAAPSGGGSDLPGAREEARAIQKLCAAMTGELGEDIKFECEAVIGKPMTRTVLRKLIRDGRYDILHFAGHGTYHKDPARSGWLLSDGLLTVTELRNTLAWSESPPWLIYANACNAGMIGDQATSLYSGEVHGMADACIRAGVNAYVAPLWKIHDKSAQLLATEFYRRLLLERTTIGVALHQARIDVRKTWETARGDTELGDVSWAGMVLFGNPTARLNDSAD